jgi:hypothetical protein
MNKSSSKLLICIYTNKQKNEFAIGLKEDETFRTVTKVGEFYVDAFENTLIKNNNDWQEELQKWIAAAKKNESIFLEVDTVGTKLLKEVIRVISN